jgi:uncharacterized phage protein (TIGR01671 family)
MNFLTRGVLDMRERFLFRAWNCGVKRYTYWEKCEISTTWDDRYALIFRMAEGQNTYIGKYEDLEQYVGLCDMNGKMIFEGDIVRTREFGKDDGKGHNFNDFDIFTVVYHLSSFCIENESRRFIIGDKSVNLEVIGNIHGNPSLLEATI